MRFKTINLDGYDILHILPIEDNAFSHNYNNCFYVFEEADVEKIFPELSTIILNINGDKIYNLAKSIKKLAPNYSRININILNLNNNFNLSEYEKQLNEIVLYIINCFEKNNRFIEINVITDLLFLKEHERCGAGDTSFTYAPDGKVYICPAYYSKNMENIGDLEKGIKISNKHLYSLDYSPICKTCDAFQCESCVFVNKTNTYEVNVSPAFQCKKAHIERKAALRLQNQLDDKIQFTNTLSSIHYKDPYDNMKSAGKDIGFLELRKYE